MSANEIGTSDAAAHEIRGRCGAWAETRRSLPFRLGINLFVWSFPALRREMFFDDLLRQQRECDVPCELLREGREALILVSCPTALTGPAKGRITFLRNAIRYVPAARTNFYISLRGTFADYLAKLPAKARHELLRKRHRFIENAGGIDPVIRLYRTQPEAEEFYRLARTVSVKTYQFRIGVGIPGETRFRAHLIEEAALDRLRGFVLFLRDRPVAFGSCKIEGDILFYMKTGYDPEFHSCSPGNVLLYGMLEHSFAEQRCRVMDLGIGEAQWKRMYSTEERAVSEAYYLRKTLTNACLAVTHNAVTALSDFGGRLLTWLHLKERYRKLLRSSFT